MALGLAAVLLVGCSDAPRAGASGLRGVLGEAGDTTGFETADRVIEFAFPRDHGPHPRFRSEWWYLTAVLTAAGGRTFGTQFTLFRQGLAPRAPGDAPPSGAAAWRTGQIYMAHVAVSDVATRRHRHAERIARDHPALAGVTATPFAAYLEDWRLESLSADFLPLKLAAATAEFDVTLTLTGTKPIVLQGEHGLSHKGPDNASYYYSLPRIDARGSVRIDGTRHPVVGRAWLDREWSTSVLAAEYAGWDWFALHLDDGRDVMVFRLRRIDGAPDRYGAGSLVAVNGDATTLADGDFRLAVIDTWGAWPVRWELTLNGDRPERFLVEAAFEDQVMDTSVRYWEGVVAVRDGDGRPAGSGYLEMTGVRAMSGLDWDKVRSERGPDLGILDVRFDWMRHPSGERVLKRLVLESVDWINIVALTPDGRSIMVDQYRFGIGARTLETPGGMVDPGETPLAAAQRELLEETGYGGGTWRSLGAVEPNPAIHPHLCHHFLADGVTRLREPEPGPGEAIGLEFLDLDGIRAAMRDGRLRHVLALSALSRVFPLFP